MTRPRQERPTDGTDHTAPTDSTGSTTRTPPRAPPSPPPPAPPWAVRSAQLITLIVLPTALWRLAMVLGFPSGYTAAGFVPFDTPCAKLWMLTLSVVCELLALWGPLLGAVTVSYYRRTRPA
ncbi:hypothetical protein [Streptomyces griseus]